MTRRRIYRRRPAAAAIAAAFGLAAVAAVHGAGASLAGSATAPLACEFVLTEGDRFEARMSAGIRTAGTWELEVTTAAGDMRRSGMFSIAPGRIITLTSSALTDTPAEAELVLRWEDQTTGCTSRPNGTAL